MDGGEEEGLSPYQEVARLRCSGGAANSGHRPVPEETPVAFSYNRLSFAVMMATPADLEDFAVGFSLSEGIIQSAGEIEDLAVLRSSAGVELRMWIADRPMAKLTARRRKIAGPTGCGLCGMESLAEAIRPLPVLTGGQRFSATALSEAMNALTGLQPLNARTHAVHAAGFWRPGSPGAMLVREDVGRHNAMDKLAGGLARAGTPRTETASGAALLTSRLSIELIQKVALLGAPLVAAISVPTALALRAAEAAGLTVVGIARADGFEIFTHPDRVILA